MTRRNIARLILVLWIAALGWLAQRQLLPGEGNRLTTGAQRFPPDARYFRVDVGDVQVGVLNITWDTLPTGFSVRELLALDLPGGPQGLTRHLAATTAITSRALTFQEVTRTYSSLGGGEEQEARVVRDSLLQFQLRIREGGTYGHRAGFAERPTLPALLPMRLAYGGALGTGSELAMTVVDLERRDLHPLAVRVLGDTTFILPDSVEADSVTGAFRTITMDTIPTWRLAVPTNPGEETWWVDRLGRLVRRESPFGVTLQMGPFDYTQMLYRDTLRMTGPAPRLELAGARTLAAVGTRLDTAAAEIRYRASRVDGALGPGQIALLAGGAQEAEGDSILVVTRRWPAGTTEPPGGYDVQPPGERGPNARVRAAADSAVAGARTLRDSVVGLTRWATARIARDTSAVRHRDPDVVERQGSGNPAGLAVFVAAMARNVGLAARTVSGVAVTPEGLLAHAWAEIWAGGGWVPVDPWHGHAPASARLVRVAEGGLGRPFESLLRLGALRLEPITSGVR